MPKQVDHEARREQLAAALWRLVMRDGIEAASLRRVAAEAGWSTGSLRHYFSSQSELLEFAMELVARRVRERISALPADADGVSTATRLLAQVLPVDEERRAEMRVWLAFTSRSLVDPGLRDLRTSAHEALREMCREAVELFDVRASGEDVERLHALIDGLALHAVLSPQVTSPERQIELLQAHLEELSRRRPE